MAWTQLRDERFRTRPKAVTKSTMLEALPKHKVKPPVLEALPEPLPGPVSSASARLRAALQYEDAEAAEVKNFLTANGLHQYVEAFMENGFDCMEVVQEMEEKHMQELGMKPGHILKLRLRLGSGRGSHDGRLSVPEVNDPAAGQQLALTASTETPSRGQRALTASSEAPSAGTWQGRSLLDGELDEEVEAAAFKEAVAAWRGQEGQNGPTPTSLSSPGQTALKKCCYQCFRQYFETKDAKPGPSFCSEQCADLHAESLRLKEEQRQHRLKEIQSNQT
ncbi:unnamed protein product [Durusdinium trenchii]|uniref:SAM domain-containing protein n=1 Tax=Durusdinium trenchii TaxID=1381693 RepID=A0ABP0PCL0_9DINO